MGYNVAVVGATGVVGREMLQILEERQFPIDNVYALASRRSVGREASFGENKILKVAAVDNHDWSTTDIALFAAGSAVVREYGPKAAKAGCIVIDNSSSYRMDPDVPLIVPEVNPEDIDGYGKKNIIANPNCSTAQMVVALKPLHDIAKIKRIVVSTFQSVSGAGNDAMDELFTQTRAIFVNDDVKSENFTKQIAFNVIPHIGDFLDDGGTEEELKMVNETHKMLDPDIEVTVTCVRVPVFVGHSESINIEFESALDEKTAREALRTAPGIMVVDKREDGGYITPLECVGEFATYVSRIRKDPTVKHGLNLWCVSDNLRKGAALNAVQIAELLGRKHLKKAS